METKGKTILIAVDGSEKAVHDALDIANADRDVVILLHIVHLFPFASKESIEQAKMQGEQFLQKSKNFAESKKKIQKLQIQMSEAADVKAEILNQARLLAVDMIVVGSKGSNAVARHLLGTTCDYIARYAPCNVLIVRNE